MPDEAVPAAHSPLYTINVASIYQIHYKLSAGYNALFLDFGVAGIY